MAIRATVNDSAYKQLRQLEEQWKDETAVADRIDAHLYGDWTQSMIKGMVHNSIRLGDLINTNVLVNRHVLRQEGIDPDSVRVALFNEVGSPVSFPQYHMLVLNAESLGGSNQELYLVIAHELTHLKQLLSGELPMERVREVVKQTPYHMDRPHEQEAVFWETQQGAKFGWDRDDFQRYYARLYPSLAHAPELVVEKQLRRQAAMSVLTRHPVAVRRHWRRR